MRRTEEEKNLLAKLASGVLDGMVGDEREYRGYRSVFCGKYIKDGEPVSYRQGESTRFFNGKENERIPGKREDEHYDMAARLCWPSLIRNREVIDILIVPTCSIVSSAGINSIFPSTETVNAEKT